MKNKRLNYWWLFSCFFLLLQCKGEEEDSTTSVTPSPQEITTFSNPLLSSGPDPWVYQKDSYYYYTHTIGNKIGLIRTQDISQIGKEAFTTVWTPPATGAYSQDIWAPELHYLDGKWYIYFAADDGNDANHRLYVLESSSTNPLAGTWTLKGKISDTSDRWAIDGSVFEYNNQRYFIWSGWNGTNDSGNQKIYIARMSNPWTLEGERIKISQPDYSWEMNGLVNEGPEVIKNSQGRVFLTYSASGCWTDDYALGLLTLKEGGDPLVPADWIKSTTPVFSKNATSKAYGPGHNGFFKSPDGTEDWIIYHANATSGAGCGATRSPRIQKFTWNADGSPNFGTPVEINTNITRPSGEVE